jgi:hypothetical protein
MSRSITHNRRRTSASSRSESEIRQELCPDCAVPPGTDCDHSRDPYPLTKRSELQRQRSSHYSRMLVCYGRGPAEALTVSLQACTVARSAPLLSDPQSAEVVAVILASCPRHKLPPGERCPRGTACSGRKQAAAAVVIRGRIPEETPLCSCVVCDGSLFARVEVEAMTAIARADAVSAGMEATA